MSALMKRLKLPESEFENNWPLFFHVYRTTFLSYNHKTNVDLVASAALPGMIFRAHLLIYFRRCTFRSI